MSFFRDLKTINHWKMPVTLKYRNIIQVLWILDCFHFILRTLLLIIPIYEFVEYFIRNIKLMIHICRDTLNIVVWMIVFCIRQMSQFSMKLSLKKILVMSYGNALWWCVKYLTKSSHLKKNQGTSIYFSKCVIFQIALYEEQ